LQASYTFLAKAVRSTTLLALIAEVNLGFDFIYNFGKTIRFFIMEAEILDIHEWEKFAAKYLSSHSQKERVDRINDILKSNNVIMEGMILLARFCLSDSMIELKASNLSEVTRAGLIFEMNSNLHKVSFSLKYKYLCDFVGC